MPDMCVMKGREYAYVSIMKRGLEDQDSLLIGPSMYTLVTGYVQHVGGKGVCKLHVLRIVSHCTK